MDDELREEEDREVDFPGIKRGKDPKSVGDDFDDGLHDDLEDITGDGLGEDESLEKLIEEEEEEFDDLEEEERDTW